jgi:uncharacterized protein (TIRG00374 family)
MKPPPVKLVATHGENPASLVGGRLGLARWAFGVFLFAALVVVVLHFGDMQDFVQLARAAEPEWLLLAVLAQVATYVSIGAIWREALKEAGHARSLASLVTLGIAKLFADQAISIGGMSGTILLMRGLARRDIPPRIAIAALLVEMVTYYGAYLIVVLIGVGLLLANYKANSLILIGAVVFTIMAVAVPGGVLWVRHLGRLPLPAWTERFPKAMSVLKAVVEAPSDLLRNRNLIVRVAALQLGVFLLGALTLWFSFRALGSSPPFWISFVAFVIASSAATISVIPLGLGSFEAASVMVLHLLGVSLGPGLTATLLLRILTFWLPMIPGLLLMRREFQDED